MGTSTSQERHAVGGALDVLIGSEFVYLDGTNPAVDTYGGPHSLVIGEAMPRGRCGGGGWHFFFRRGSGCPLGFFFSLFLNNFPLIPGLCYYLCRASELLLSGTGIVMQRRLRLL